LGPEDRDRLFGSSTVTTPANHPVNLRDVGGLTLAGGGVTRSGALYRSDALYPGDEVPAALPAWPPAVVVDLRSEFEREHAGTFPWSAATRAHHVPLMGEAAPRLTDVRLADLYLDTLRATGPLIVEVAAIVADAPGPALVQCAAGKDRTGVVIAVLLLAAGVEPPEVIADYTATALNMPAVIPRMAARLGWDMPPFDDLPPLLRDAPADAIAAVIDTVCAVPGGAAGWLSAHGLPPAGLARLRAKLS
jgi:hypothetical protein